MAEIAVQLQEALAQRRALGAPGRAEARVRAAGEGWAAADVLCTSGPQERPFEEQHARYAIAVVVAGTFQYRSAIGSAVMTPGSLLLGHPGLCFECGHEHGEGDRCVAFSFEPGYFERLASDAGHPVQRAGFATARIPPLRTVADAVATTAAGLAGSRGDVFWEELGLRIAARALRLAGDLRTGARAPLNAEARVTRAVRLIDRRSDAPLSLSGLARHAGLSPYHFLRTFQRVTGVSPHQYLVRARLRQAAIALATQANNVAEVALASGFGDVSNFNRAFRAEFGRSPRSWRRERPRIDRDDHAIAAGESA